MRGLKNSLLKYCKLAETHLRAESFNPLYILSINETGLKDSLNDEEVYIPNYDIMVSGHFAPWSFRFLRSPPPPPSFVFWLSPHFSRGKNTENPVPPSVFLCFQTPWKRLLRRLPVTSPQPKVISPRNRSNFAPCKSHFAPCRSYFAPCKKLVKFVVNFPFSNDFELNTMAFQILTNAASSRVRLNTLGNTKYNFVRLLSST